MTQQLFNKLANTYVLTSPYYHVVPVSCCHFQGRWIGEKHNLFIKFPITKENHDFLFFLFLQLLYRIE